MASNDNSVLLVGNFLSGQVGNHCVCEDLAPRLEQSGLNVLTTSYRKGRLLRLADMVSTIIRRRREYNVANVDVYSGRAFLLNEATCAALRWVGKPYVLTLRGGHLPVYAKTRKKRVTRLLQSASCVTTPSEYLLDQMRPYRSDLQLLPNPVDVTAYPYRHRQHAQPTLMWLRSFHGTYNPTMAIEVLADLSKDYPNARLVMVGRDKGDGSLQQTQQKANELGVVDRVEFVGGVEKKRVPELLQQGDIFLNTTNIDNTPVSVLEAMACGLCVTSTNAGGMPYLVNDGDEALLVPANDTAAMTAAVRRILTDDTLAGQLSANGRKKAESFDWQTILPQWNRVFTEAMALKSV